jgi:RNA polymerase sigma-70 factor (ECF subfamily)
MTGFDQKSDLDLVRLFQTGDQSSFEEIVRRYQDRIYSLCRRILGNAGDAEDAAQDVFVKTYQNLQRFQPNASLYTWLYRIAVNTCVDYRRRPLFESLFRRSAEGEEVMFDPPSEAPSPERLYESTQIERALQRGLSRLSPKLRAALVLREVEGLSYERISEVLGVSVGTVKSRLSRAREDLVGQLRSIREEALK